jgi:8-oxo-dGTP diphosphatase
LHRGLLCFRHGRPSRTWYARSVIPIRLLPKSVMTILREAARHALKRPVVGVCAAATAPDGRWLLIRRADTGTWALPGGTVEWGERLPTCLERELWEEAGTKVVALRGIAGVYSEPSRDPRFHAVTVVLRCDVAIPEAPPKNPLEITEVGLFADHELPDTLAFGMEEMLRGARSGLPPVLE